MVNPTSPHLEGSVRGSEKHITKGISGKCRVSTSSSLASTHGEDKFVAPKVPSKQAASWMRETSMAPGLIPGLILQENPQAPSPAAQGSREHHEGFEEAKQRSLVGPEGHRAGFPAGPEGHRAGSPAAIQGQRPPCKRNPRPWTMRRISAAGLQPKRRQLRGSSKICTVRRSSATPDPRTHLFGNRGHFHNSRESWHTGHLLHASQSAEGLPLPLSGTPREPRRRTEAQAPHASSWVCVLRSPCAQV